MAMNHIMVYYDWPERTRHLTFEQKGRLVEALVLYARGDFDCCDDILTGDEKHYFYMFSVGIDSSQANYNALTDARSEAGRKGGLAKQANKAKAMANVANVANAKDATKSDTAVANVANGSKRSKANKANKTDKDSKVSKVSYKEPEQEQDYNEEDYCGTTNRTPISSKNEKNSNSTTTTNSNSDSVSCCSTKKFDIKDYGVDAATLAMYLSLKYDIDHNADEIGVLLQEFESPVLWWAAQKSQDRAKKTPTAYFDGIINNKREQECFTLGDLICAEATSSVERQLMRQRLEKIKKEIDECELLPF